MKIGSVVEFIDRQKIICAVVVELKGDRIHLITEANREINLSPKRFTHAGGTFLDPSLGRDRLVGMLREITARRATLMHHVDIRELWEVLHSEPDWIDIATLTGLCFPDAPEGDHEAAVVRALFDQRRYFKFDHGRFFPNSETKIRQLEAEAEEANRRRDIIEKGKRWLKTVLEKESRKVSEEEGPYTDMLKDYYLLEKESPSYDLTHAILTDSGCGTPDQIFRLLVQRGVWTPDENIDLIRLQIPTRFSNESIAAAESLIREGGPVPARIRSDPRRRDLTDLPIMTIDGQATMDFDDALSIEALGDACRLGIHIADVAERIGKESLLDREARFRGSSIYMPDQRIPMLPAALSEDLCSLRCGEVRPALSILVELHPNGTLSNWEIFPSTVRVKDQLTYQDANLIFSQDSRLQRLVETARRYRRKRLDQGGLQITLPEMHLHLDENGEVSIGRINRESPSRFAVTEIMILANWLMATFLKERGICAVFRSQPQPKERLYNGDGGTLFQNWMQRKLLSRFVLGPGPESHSGLGLDAYVTGTSPIRKYYDLVTQRQIRSAFGLESPYSKEAVEGLIAELEPVMAHVAAIQARRNRYWLFKYLEKRIGQKEEALVLGKARNGYQILIPEYMIECRVPVPSGYELKPEDTIRITLQHVDARNDHLNVFMS